MALLVSSLLSVQAERGNPRIQFEGQGVDEMIADFMEENGVPGMSLAIVQAPYITRVSSYGMADPARQLLVAGHTVFDVAQMQNAYAAVAVMQLVEAGKIKLDDPLNQYLPTWRSEKRTVREALGQAEAYPMLEKLVSVASGEDYEDFVRKGQFERLGLQHTFFAKALAQVSHEDFAAGERHGKFLHDATLINPTEAAVGQHEKAGKLETVIPSALGLYSTAEDISTWDVGLAGDILIRQAELRKILYQAPIGPDGAKIPTSGPWVFPGHQGLMVTTGDRDGFSSLLSRFTKADELVCVTLLANKDGVDLTQLARKIAGAYDVKLGPPVHTSDLRVQQSPYSVKETIDRLEKILRDRGVGIVARIDHRQAAEGKELELRPTEELIFGNPAKGTLLMQQNPAMAADLPLRAAAWEENGEVWLVATDPVELVQRNGLEDQRKLALEMRQGVDSALLKAVAP